MQVQPGLKAPMSVEKMMAMYEVNLPGKVEVIWQPLYDYQPVVAAATANQLYFQVPAGQGTPIKTVNDTNMELQGQIPAGQRFVITGIEVDFTPDLTISSTAVANQFWDDVFDFYRQGNLNLNIGSKSYLLQGPLMSFPPTRRLGGAASIALSAAAAPLVQGYNYAIAGGQEFKIRPLVLQANQNFNVAIQNRLALSTTGRAGVKLNGWLFRNAQ